MDARQTLHPARKIICTLFDMQQIILYKEAATNYCNSLDKLPTSREDVIFHLAAFVSQISEKSDDWDTAFAAFIEMRKKIKKPPTEYAIKLIKKELNKIAMNDEALQIEILNQSIRNCWQDVFPLKIQYQQKPQHTEQTPVVLSSKFNG